MPDKDESTKNKDAKDQSSGQENESGQSASIVPNPFEKNHGELSRETLDSLEQFKEAQTERD